MFGNILKYLKSQVEPSPSEVKGLFVILFIGFVGVAYDYYKRLTTPPATKLRLNIAEKKLEPDTAMFIVERREFMRRKPVYRKVNINTASVKELLDLPGVGPKIAKRIYEYRRMKGRIRSINELLNIKGIGPKKLEKMKKYVVL